MKDSLGISDVISQVITIIVAVLIFQVNEEKSVNLLIWFMCIISAIVTFCFFVICIQGNDKSYTKNKAVFKFIYIFILSFIFAYFGHWVAATFIFISHFLFIFACASEV